MPPRYKATKMGNGDWCLLDLKDFEGNAQRLTFEQMAAMLGQHFYIVGSSSEKEDSRAAKVRRAKLLAAVST